MALVPMAGCNIQHNEAISHEYARHIRVVIGLVGKTLSHYDTRSLTHPVSNTLNQLAHLLSVYLILTLREELKSLLIRRPVTRDSPPQ